MNRITISKKLEDYIVSAVLPDKFLLRGIKKIRKIAGILVTVENELRGGSCEFLMDIQHSSSSREYDAIYNFLISVVARMSADINSGRYIPGKKWGNYLEAIGANRFNGNGRDRKGN